MPPKFYWFNSSCLDQTVLIVGELVTKYAKRNSFFNFFTPPQTVREWILDPKKSALMEAHFEIGLFFKETFVSKA